MSIPSAPVTQSAIDPQAQYITVVGMYGDFQMFIKGPYRFKRLIVPLKEEPFHFVKGDTFAEIEYVDPEDERETEIISYSDLGFVPERYYALRRAFLATLENIAFFQEIVRGRSLTAYAEIIAGTLLPHEQYLADPKNWDDIHESFDMFMATPSLGLSLR